MRGELGVFCRQLSIHIGSSPLARGTLRHKNCRPRIQRFIPACAGNSVDRSLPVIIEGGSSPLARGTQSPGFFCSPQNRFIPACAGNSIELNKPIICSPVHPRLRGELRFHLLGARFLIGSSPLARGTRLNTLGSRFFRRFIPACAGNSLKMVTTLH